jgi:transcriptional regulator with XRE-family HTH domain
MKKSDKPNNNENADSSLRVEFAKNGHEEEVLKSKENLAKMVKALRGNRTIRELASSTGVAPSYISGIENGKFIPSATILMKLASPRSKPQNGITVKDLMTVSGYEVEDSNIIDSVESLTRYRDDIDQFDLAKRPEKEYLSTKELWVRNVFVPLTIGVIYGALEKKGIHFSNGQETTMLRRRGTLVMDISIFDGPINDWCFLLRYTSRFRSPIQLAEQMITMDLGELLLLEPKPDRKISFVINNKEVFEEIIKYKGKLAFRGDVSVILFTGGHLEDMKLDDFFEENKVINEEYLAHYNDQDTSSELYII